MLFRSVCARAPGEKELFRHVARERERNGRDREKMCAGGKFLRKSDFCFWC